MSAQQQSLQWYKTLLDQKLQHFEQLASVDAMFAVYIDHILRIKSELRKSIQQSFESKKRIIEQHLHMISISPPNIPNPQSVPSTFRFNINDMAPLFTKSNTSTVQTIDSSADDRNSFEQDSSHESFDWEDPSNSASQTSDSEGEYVPPLVNIKKSSDRRMPTRSQTKTLKSSDHDSSSSSSSGDDSDTTNQKESSGSESRAFGKKSKRTKHQCNICNRKFPFQSYLRSHMKTHEGNRELYQCSYDGCEKSFTREFYLKQHMNIHTKKFECSECHKCFISKDKLSKHLPCGNKRFPCSFQGCTASYNAKKVLRLHMNVHRKPFQCKECNKHFGNAGGLNRHQKVHNGAERPFKCDACGRKFRTECGLKYHVQHVCCKSAEMIIN